MKKNLLMILLIVLLIPMLFGEQSMLEEIESNLILEKYSRETVIKLLTELNLYWTKSLQEIEADFEIILEKTTKEAVKAAVIPLMAKVDDLEMKNKQLKRKIISFTITGIITGGLFATILTRSIFGSK